VCSCCRFLIIKKFSDKNINKLQPLNLDMIRSDHKYSVDKWIEENKAISDDESSNSDN